jgi:hypothetical protein
VDPAGLINVLMLVGLFHGDQLVHREIKTTPRANCEAAQSYAAEFNSRFQWFWEEDTQESIQVACIPHPEDREA